MSGPAKSCCTPTRVETGTTGDGLLSDLAADARVCATPDAQRMVRIDAISFVMGTDSTEGFTDDGEGPSRTVSLSGFRISPTAVTNREFSAFVRATRYVTDAERLGSSFVFYLNVTASLRGEVRRALTGLPWWLDVRDASWQRPEGPMSSVHSRLDHPVVHVSWSDCQAYCAWSESRLPTEAEWECAARGRLTGQRFPWGNDFAHDGQLRCNIWRGTFPAAPTPGWTPGTVPVDAFEANGLGLYNVSGNIWEWCADWFSPTYHRDSPSTDPLTIVATGRRSMRGGSFLCHDSYCNRYRVAARSSNSPSSSASNIGFRVADDRPAANLPSEIARRTG